MSDLNVCVINVHEKKRQNCNFKKFIQNSENKLLPKYTGIRYNLHVQMIKLPAKWYHQSRWFVWLEFYIAVFC